MLRAPAPCRRSQGKMFIRGLVSRRTRTNLHVDVLIDQATGLLWADGCTGPMLRPSPDFSQAEPRSAVAAVRRGGTARAAKRAGVRGDPKRTRTMYTASASTRSGRLTAFSLQAERCLPAARRLRARWRAADAAALGPIIPMHHAAATTPHPNHGNSPGPTKGKFTPSRPSAQATTGAAPPTGSCPSALFPLLAPLFARC